MGLWVRSDWRSRRASLVALALLAGLSFAVVATAFAGARRTATSFDRLRASTRAYDHGIAVDAPGTFPDHPGRDRYDDATVRRVRRLPQLADVGEAVFYIASLPDADWEFSLAAPADDVLGHRIVHDRILRGRMPDPARVDEVVINEATVAQAHVDVGRVLHLVTLTPTQRAQLIAGDEHAFDNGPTGPKLALKVVGVSRGVTDVLGRPDPTMFATPAFDRLYRGRVAYSSRMLLVRRRAGTTDREFHQSLARVLPSVPLGAFDASTEDKSARHTTRTLSVGLLVFALVAALVSVLAVGQAVARHLAGVNAEQARLAALGLTRVQRIRGLVGTILPAAAAGAVLAVCVSFAASPLTPVGLARQIEPHPGLHFDAMVAISAAVAVIVVVAAAALLAAIPLTRVRAHERVRRASGLAAGAAGGGPVLATGVRYAVDRRPPSLPVRSASLAVAGTVVVLVAAITFAASLDRLVREPTRWGYGWDLMLDTAVPSLDRMTHQLAADPELEGVSLLSTDFTFARGDGGVRAYGLERVKGTAAYSLLSGVQPIAPDEVVVGPEAAHKLGVHAGDTVQVAVCPCAGEPNGPTSAVRVVGVALFPEGEDGNFGNALGFSGSGFERHVGTPHDSRMALRIAPGRRLAAVARDLGRRYPGQLSKYSYPTIPGEVATVAGLRSFPRILAVFTGLLGLAALANLLAATLRRRRNELATLRSLGLTPRQAGGCLVWQSCSVMGLGLAAGIPCGVIVGSLAWVAATHGIGIATDADRPSVAIVAFAVASLAAGGAIALPASWRAARLPLADTLRTE